MGNCITAESSTAGERKDIARTQAKYIENSSSPPTPETSVVLYDEGTGEEYRVGVGNLKMALWSTVKGEWAKRGQRARKITYGGTEISETQTWEQLGISDDAMVIVETETQEP